MGIAYGVIRWHADATNPLLTGGQKVNPKLSREISVVVRLPKSRSMALTKSTQSTLSTLSLRSRVTLRLGQMSKYDISIVLTLGTARRIT